MALNITIGVIHLSNLSYFITAHVQRTYHNEAVSVLLLRRSNIVIQSNMLLDVM